MSRKEILDKAALEYPINSKYYPLGQLGNEYKEIATAVRSSRYFTRDDSCDVGLGYVYVQGKWARKVDSVNNNYSIY